MKTLFRNWMQRLTWRIANWLIDIAHWLTRRYTNDKGQTWFEENVL